MSLQNKIIKGTTFEGDKKAMIATLLFVLIFSGYWLLGYFDRIDVLRDYSKTKGWIYNYFTIGVEKSRGLEYEYYVNGSRYTRKITPSTNKFDFCEEDIDKCAHKEFWVIFSPENPHKSLIYLKMEIQGKENPPFPKTLDDFE